MGVDTDTGWLPVVTTNRLTEYEPDAIPIGSTMKAESVCPGPKVALDAPMPTVWPTLFFQTAKITTLGSGPRF